jgi:hypothetical protein
MAGAGYCPTCGIDRRQGDRFCRNCGRDLGAADPHEVTVVREVVGEPTTPLTPAADSASAGPATGGASLPPPPSAPAPAAPVAPTTPPVASPAAPTAAAGSQLPFRPVALAGGVAIVVAALLPWFGAGSLNALDLPLPVVWDFAAGDSALKLGTVLIAFGVLGGGLSFVPRTAWLRRLLGGLTISAVTGYTVQVLRFIDTSGGSFADLGDVIGAGVYVALAGGIALIVSR